MAFGRWGRRSEGNRDRNRFERWLNDVTHQIHRQVDTATGQEEDERAEVRAAQG
jgi:hypothetical protein